MRDRFPFLFIGGLLLLGFVGASLFQGASRGSFADTLSTYRSDPDGARALYLLAEGASIPVGRLQRNLDVIEERSSLVLLAVEFSEATDPLHDPDSFFHLSPDGGVPPSKPDDDDDEKDDEKLHRGMNVFHASRVYKDEREKLLEAVKAGTTLVYVPWGAQENPLLRALDVHLRKAERELELRTLVPAQPTPFTVGVERVEARVQSFLDLPEDAIPLLVDERLQSAVAALVPYGQGRVVIIGAPELAMNKALARADNAQLWLSTLRAVAQDGPVSFDEFHHGFSNDRSVAEFAARYGLQYAALQLLAGAVLWAGSLRRFGRPRPPPADVRLGSTDTLFAASRIYREGKHHGFAAMLIARGLTQDLTAAAALPFRAEGGEVCAALEARGRKDLADGLAEALRLASAAQSDADVQRVAQKAASTRALLTPRRRPHAAAPSKPADDRKTNP